jgi:hypothetical protein
VVLEAVKRRGYSLQCAHEKLQYDEEVALAAARSHFGFYDVNERFKKNREFILKIFKERRTSNWTDILTNVDTIFKNDRELALKAIQFNPLEFCGPSEILKNDRELVMEAVKGDGDVLQYVPNVFKDDVEVVYCAITQKGNVLNYASIKLKHNKELIRIAYQNETRNEPVFDIFDDDFIVQEKAFFIQLVLEKQKQGPARLVGNYAHPYYDITIQCT